jgi:hypothetical protein
VNTENGTAILRAIDMIGRSRRAQQCGNVRAFALVADADRNFPIQAAPADHVNAIAGASAIGLDDGVREGLTEGRFDAVCPFPIVRGRTQSFDESHHLIDE